MRRVVVFLVLLIQLGLFTPAKAGYITLSSRAQITSSGSWSVVASAINQPTVNTSYTLVWSVSSGTAYNFFVFRNTGSLLLNSFTVEISQTQFGGSGKPNDTVFELCRFGSWNPATNICSGSIQLLGRASDLIIQPINLNFISGSELSMRASTATNVKNSYTTTLNVSVNRNQARGSLWFNS